MISPSDTTTGPQPKKWQSITHSEHICMAHEVHCIARYIMTFIEG